MKSFTSGWINGFLGMLIFSGSLPATRLAVMDFDPVFLTVSRAAIAGLVAAGVLVLLEQKRPGRSEAVPLLLVALGVVVGFPLLTALALQHATAAHSTVYVALLPLLPLLPLVTALFGVLRAGEGPRPAFWFFSILGSVLVAGFAWSSGTSSSMSSVLYSGIAGWLREASRQWGNCSCCNRLSACCWRLCCWERQSVPPCWLLRSWSFFV